MATNGQILETGIDKLVKLVNSSGKISVSEAAKELEVNQTVILEWADSLEERGLLSFEHRLLNTFLVLRDMTREEVRIKLKEFNGKKDILIRKAEGTLSNLSKEKEKFKEVVNEFSKLKKMVYTNKSLKDELQKLEEYKKIKDDLNNEIKKSRNKLVTLRTHVDKFNLQARKERDEIRLLIRESMRQKKEIIKNEKLKRELKRYLNFVDKKMETINLVLNIDKNRNEIREELSELVKKAKALQVSPQNGNSGRDITNIEKKFEDIHIKKALLEEEYKKMTVGIPAIFDKLEN